MAFLDNHLCWPPCGPRIASERSPTTVSQASELGDFRLCDSCVPKSDDSVSQKNSYCLTLVPKAASHRSTKSPSFSKEVSRVGFEEEEIRNQNMAYVLNIC